MTRKFRYPIIVALDGVELDDKLVALVQELFGKVWGFKINDLHDRSPGALNFLAKWGSVMVDMKIFDIPSTAANRVRALADQGASIITVHASGGHRMLEACIHALAEFDCWIAPVCVLTSMEDDEVREVYGGDSTLGLYDRIFARLSSYVRATMEELDLTERAMVVPPNKLGLIPDFSAWIKICPGIRPAMYTVEDDQRNVNTPGNAMRDGADLLVVGRPIMESSDPVGAVAAITAEVDAAMPWEQDKDNE